MPVFVNVDSSATSDDMRVLREALGFPRREAPASNAFRRFATRSNADPVKASAASAPQVRLFRPAEAEGG